MVNYNNGKVYKIEPITGVDTGDVYIGSTAKQYLSQRMTSHRYGYKYWKEGKQLKITSYDLFDKYGVENCQIVLLETVMANSKEELLAREAFYIKSMLCVNKVMLGRTRKEYMKDTMTPVKQKVMKEYQQQYRETYTEKIKEYNDGYHSREDIKERRRLREQAKQNIINEEKLKFNEEHKEEIEAERMRKKKETSKRYREKNRESINERQQKQRAEVK